MHHQRSPHLGVGVFPAGTQPRLLASRNARHPVQLACVAAGNANPTGLTLTAIAGVLAVPVVHLLTAYGSPD